MVAAQTFLRVEPGNSTFEDALIEAVTAALQKTGYYQLCQLLVAVDGHEVTLQGRLPSYYLKQIAHHAVANVPGVNIILDRIDVLP